ncbi:MAG: hydrogenase maturation nickel metallochaperone HypA [Proteobacteria bacterium]|nr:hydrogenase maturation nickel metallochaperone HypA [Pseudomonadota bacterium]MBU1060040.1 hydrogenase maturation nickel metallochaperone HypA [Pseudomonadota bacterium]
MHEMSLVQGLLNQLHDLAREHNKTKVISVCMDIGPLSGVVMDSFQFGFDILSQENPLTRGARLEIVSSPVIYRCSGCDAKIEEESKPQACPACSETLLYPEGGDDIILRQVQME